MKILTLLVVLLTFACAPSTKGDLTLVLLGCFQGVVEQGLNSNALEKCITSAGGKLTNGLLNKLGELLGDKFTDIDLDKIFHTYFNTPPDAQLVIVDRNLKINLILEKTRVLYE